MCTIIQLSSSELWKVELFRARRSPDLHQRIVRLLRKQTTEQIRRNKVRRTPFLSLLKDEAHQESRKGKKALGDEDCQKHKKRIGSAPQETATLHSWAYKVIGRRIDLSHFHDPLQTSDDLIPIENSLDDFSKPKR
jgi:hypothetical protein